MSGAKAPSFKKEYLIISDVSKTHIVNSELDGFIYKQYKNLTPHKHNLIYLSSKIPSGVGKYELRPHETATFIPEIPDMIGENSNWILHISNEYDIDTSAENYDLRTLNMSHCAKIHLQSSADNCIVTFGDRKIAETRGNALSFFFREPAEFIVAPVIEKELMAE